MTRARTEAAKSRDEPERDDVRSWRRHSLAKRFEPKKLTELVTDYQAGSGSTVLARKYGVSENAVTAHLRRCGVELRPPGKVTVDDVTEMRRLRADGWHTKPLQTSSG